MTVSSNAAVPENEPGRPQPKVRLVCTIGGARTGGTLLDILLDNNRSVSATGELFLFPERVNREDQFCTCGRPLPQCPLWSAVAEECTSRFSLEDLKKGRARYERARALPLIALGRLFKSDRLNRHISHMGILIQAVATHAQAEFVTDSSKHPVRGWLYSFLPADQFDVRYIHLIRDGEAVMNAMHVRPDGGYVVSTRPPDRVAHSAIWWVGVNLLASLLGVLNRSKYLRLRYEDLVSHPVPTLQTIGSFLEMDVTQATRLLVSGEAFSAKHLVAGNRVRFGKISGIRASPTPVLGGWKVPFGFRVVFGWFRLLYGYRRTEGTATSSRTLGTQ